MKNIFHKCLLISLFFISGDIFAQADLRKAISLIEENKIEEAQEILENLLDKDENNPEINFYMGRAYLKLKDFSEASDYFEDAIEIEGNKAEYHFWLAQAYAGDAQESSFISAAFIAPKIKDEFAKTVEIDPEHLGGYIGLANFHLNAPGIVGGDLDEAYKVGKTLLKLDEKSGRLTLINYFVKKELFNSVETQLSIIEKKYGDDKSIANFYNTYGYLLIDQKKYTDAIKYFKKQVALLPKNPNSYDSLGDGYRAAGKLKEAAAEYRKALKLDPKFEASKNNLEEVLDMLESK